MVDEQPNPPVNDPSAGGGPGPGKEPWKSRLGRFLNSKVREPLRTLGEQAWPGAAIGAVAAFLVAMLFFGSIGRTGLGTVPDILVLGLFGLGALFLTAKLLELVFSLVRALPKPFVGAVGGALIVLLLTGFPFVVPFLLAGVVSGAAIGAAWKRGLKRFSSVLLLIVPVGIYGFLGVTLLREGEDPFADSLKADSGAGVATVSAPNPSLPGRYAVKTLTYGSGTDAHRPEFGTGAALKTPSVDGSVLLEEPSAVQGWLRQAYWGFDLKHLPLNGTVWYPDAPGPFPLVLIVHGNHTAKEFSDPGYAYLGELLASRGFLTVSVDENFLNGEWYGDYEQKENPLRAWLLLQHLKVWRSWNAAAGNPFCGKADLGRVVLIGHSRGGQAVALAAAFNPLPRHPEKTNVKFDFRFGIRGIVQIAPNDAARPSGQPLEVKDVHYLLLQGGYDSDVNMFLGDRQYRRVKFTDGEYRLKSMLYVYRANHGQFNTVWGRSDYGAPTAWLLNLKPLLSGEAQRQIAKVYIAAFLETALRDDKGYVPMFRDWRSARGWLPPDRYVTQFQDSSRRVIADFEEDLDVGSTTLAGGTIRGENLSAWSENALLLRDDTPQGTKGVYLGWDREALADKAKKGQKPGVASYSIRLPDVQPPDWPVSGGRRLVFALANNKMDVPEADLTVELVSATGASVRLPLSKFAPICPPLKSRLTKWPMEGYFELTRPAELVLQVFSLPLAEFAEANAAFDPAQLRTVRLVFDRTPKGEVVLDDVGLETE
jgi:hypothetical protein